jgi:translation initiation factor 1 (eIF-1/SUI1)
MSDEKAQNRRGDKRDVKANNSHVKEAKASKAEKEKPEGRAKAKKVIGIRLVETRYGKRVLIEQGQNRVWLREADVVQLLSVLAREAFGKEVEE